MILYVRSFPPNNLKALLQLCRKPWRGSRRGNGSDIVKFVKHVKVVVSSRLSSFFLRLRICMSTSYSLCPKSYCSIGYGNYAQIELFLALRKATYHEAKDAFSVCVKPCLAWPEGTSACANDALLHFQQAVSALQVSFSCAAISAEAHV